MNFIQRAVVAAIEKYQASGGGHANFRVACNFQPTCSEYCRQAVIRFGAWRGLKLGLTRIRRCKDPDLVTPIPDPLPDLLTKEPLSKGKSDHA